MPMKTFVQKAEPHSPRWTLFRDLAVLQFKLLIDGFRDLVLLPASIIAALLSVVRSENGRPGPQFYNLLVVGKQSEQWINLFGALENAPDDVDHFDAFGDVDIDDIVSKVETFVIDEYKRGGVTVQAKSRLEKALAAMHRKYSSAPDAEGPGS